MKYILMVFLILMYGCNTENTPTKEVKVSTDFSCVGIGCNASQRETPYAIREGSIEAFNLPSFLKDRAINGRIFACEKHAKLWGIDKLFIDLQ